MPVKNISTLKELQENTGEVAVVDCYATWCGPCKIIAPQFEAMSDDAKYAKVAFLKLDVDKGEDVAQELDVQAMPTFFLFKNGQKVGNVVGANIANVKAQLDKLL